MKGDTDLDLVVFQLTAPRTRCELFVSADGMTEKLASGFLKPFLNHLRAVEEQVVRGCEFVKLERPQTYHGRSWFTKGTLERFVRFVSTPEVLERVKVIEDELAQLEQVRGIQASSLLQVEDSYSTADPVYQKNDGRSFSGPLGKSGNSKLPYNYKYDAVEGGREASKVELLRAMDVRLLALRQEQSMAFNRASAAGFNSDNMTDLIAFSEYFGADRLRMACFNFLIVLQGRNTEPTKLDSQAILDISTNASKGMVPKQGVLSKSNFELNKGNEADIPNAGPFINEERRHMLFNVGVSFTDDKSGSDGMQSSRAGGSDARKRWEPQENIRPPELLAAGHAINHSPASVQPNHQTTSIMEPTGSFSEDPIKVMVSSPVSAPARRLSVQDAISMFEDKQRRESIEASRKQSIDKHESGRALEGTHALSSASTGPRRWSVANSNEVCKLLQENLASSKQEAVTNISESVRSNGDVLLASKEQDEGGPQSNAFLLRTSWEPIAIPDSSIKHAPSKGSDRAYVVQETMPSRNRKQALGVSEQHTKDAATMVFVGSESTQSSGRDSLESSNDVQNHGRMHVNQTHSDADDLGEQKGRYYMQYSKLRDAKLKNDHEFKKAEREAKLRLMEETLLLRKAELDAQTLILSMRNHEQVRATKMQARKADLQTLQRAKEDAVDETEREISGHSNGRARSPPSTLLPGKEDVSSSKPLSGRKFSLAVSQKGATPPRSSTRGTSLSPNLTPRSVTGSIIKPRKSVGSSVNDIPLTKSVSSFANLRKENAKPSAGRPSGNAGLQTKDGGGSGRFRAPSEAQPLEANENTLGSTHPISGSAKEDKGLPVVWRSHCDLKILATSINDGSIAPSTHQREVGYEAGALSSLTSYGVSALRVRQSVKEEDPGSHDGRTLNLQTYITDVMDTRFEDVESKDVFVEESMETDTDEEADFSLDSGLSNALEMQMITPAIALSAETVVGNSSFAIRNAHQTTSFPSEFENRQHLAAGGQQSEEGQELATNNPHSQSGKALQSMYEVDASTSFRASSLPHEHHLPMFSHGPASPPNSRVEQVQIGTVSGHFSPSLAAGFESPLLSPAYLNASQTQYVPVPQKVVSTKETAKGFKKLLKFGRKNRASDSTTSDWASTCMTSEGDDEAEDQRVSIDAHNAKGRLDESTKGEHYITPEKTSAAQSLRSSIPTPPANFKLRDDHLMGGTMLKAPKSFFSLSSFRSRGTEGRV